MSVKQEHIIVGSNQKEMWNDYLNRLPYADIYLTPEYCEIHENNGEGLAQMFVYREDDQFVCYPYLLRSMNELPFIRSMNLSYEVFDIVTPYGYGGPLSNTMDPVRKRAMFEAFSEHFQRYCKEKNIITEFIRFHPLLKNYCDYEVALPSFVRNTIYIDLRKSEAQILADYSAENRNRIRKAIKEGLQVCHTDIQNMDDLMRLYYSTMEKKNANSYYYFSESFFQDTSRLLQTNIELIEVKLDEKVVASGLFLLYGNMAHYHLMGSNREYLPLAPVNLMIHHAALWAKSKGYEYLHLGGGYTGNDSLYRFKRTFNEKETADFYIGKRIHCPDFYEQLLLQMDENIGEDYFPFYRHPQLQA
ncbi:lipid II:glycine glycyltransferase FemX [Paenibacillus sp. MBLB4367]|uniref:lipid II:glycine glycyltransferase FemX n=1 Tax=Paenibacillus sp. MBLB4367 TaxID=3384767 RepID=UPI0039080C00